MRSCAYSRAYPKLSKRGSHDFVVRMVARDMESYDELARNLFAADERVRSFMMSSFAR